MLPANSSPEAQAYARAVRLFEMGRYGEAAATTEQVLKRRPGHEQTLMLRASALARCGRQEDARRLFKQLLRSRPAEHYLHHEIALTHLLDGNLAPAHEAIDRALAAEPANPMFAAAKGELYQAAGEHQRGVDLLRPLIERGESDPRCRIVFAELCGDLGLTEEALAALEPVLGPDSAVSPPLERRALFARVSVLDRAGRHLEAFDAASRANARTIELRGGAFDAAAHSARVDVLIHAWTRDRIAALAKSGERSDLPVFIVGMPRSGTSLIEQILAAHPQAYGAGELAMVLDLVGELWPATPPAVPVALEPSALTPGRLSRFARASLRNLRALGGSAVRVSDKNPLNFLHLGVIAGAFPGSRIIHCRRDPVDTCISSFFLDFKGDLRFTNDLSSLGRFTRDYERLMTHWRESIDVPMLDIKYEDLVGDLETNARVMLEFLGLPWNDACLRSHETERMTRTASINQVRRPVYKSAVGRASRYGDRLDPLRAALGPPA